MELGVNPQGEYFVTGFSIMSCSGNGIPSIILGISNPLKDMIKMPVSGKGFL
jgi:hypothetical protein